MFQSIFLNKLIKKGNKIMPNLLLKPKLNYFKWLRERRERERESEREPQTAAGIYIHSLVSIQSSPNYTPVFIPSM